MCATLQESLLHHFTRQTGCLLCILAVSLWMTHPPVQAEDPLPFPTTEIAPTQAGSKTTPEPEIPKPPVGLDEAPEKTSVPQSSETADKQSPEKSKDFPTEQVREEQSRQAEEHYQQGRRAIQSREWTKAIEALERAVQLLPENGKYHHALGVAYMGDQQANAGWFHFRQAVRLDSDYVPATVDFLKTWKLLDAQGVFNVGTPLPVIAQTLGKPDQADDQGVRLRLVYGFMSLNFMNSHLFSILDLRDLPPEGLHAVDGLAFDLDRDYWSVAYRQLSAVQGNTEYVPQDQSLQKWTELFASQRFINAASATNAQEVMTSIRERLRSTFEELEFEVLAESEEDVLFQWSVTAAENHPAQREIVRVVQGERDIHRLAYTRKGEKLEDSLFSPWLELLGNAELMTAADLREYLLREEEKHQEAQLRKLSVQILAKQFELIREGKAEELRVYFIDAARDRITPELLAQVTEHLEKLQPEKLVERVELTSDESGIKARLISEDGRVFTTLIQAEGRWFAENIWLESVIK
jgi:tetratricopeptide (TPR) repeat protein